jgi:hypothetical protein
MFLVYQWAYNDSRGERLKNAQRRNGMLNLRKMVCVAGMGAIGLAFMGTTVCAGEWSESKAYRTEKKVTESAPYNMAYERSGNPKALNSNSNFKDVITTTEYWLDIVAINPGGQTVPGQSTSELLATETMTQRIKIK